MSRERETGSRSLHRKIKLSEQWDRRTAYGAPLRIHLKFTPNHGSWLNLVEGFFSTLARSVLRHIRVSSRQELKDRLMAAVDYFNHDPVVHTWAYKLDKGA